ncbi:hypothetical protein C8N35_11522 [Breoghania corrubedonensis]|uniref:Uncharacterized protein n=1 Tax=Breoghania corrubedonensis TaxID=665038 RepID=A0A2T5UQY3_9HYPH|nr:hypothetical protein [Breoghania corrubedonensis]PTW53902.1 hypothetical protein C8N35_11522 [Breoghania corrubedonensis]
MSSRDLAAAACAMERARMRWERTASDADYIAFLEAEGRWQRCRIAELLAAVRDRSRVEQRRRVACAS